MNSILEFGVLLAWDVLLSSWQASTCPTMGLCVRKGISAEELSELRLGPAGSGTFPLVAFEKAGGGWEALGVTGASLGAFVPTFWM